MPDPRLARREEFRAQVLSAVQAIQARDMNPSQRLISLELGLDGVAKTSSIHAAMKELKAAGLIAILPSQGGRPVKITPAYVPLRERILAACADLLAQGLYPSDDRLHAVLEGPDATLWHIRHERRRLIDAGELVLPYSGDRRQNSGGFRGLYVEDDAVVKTNTQAVRGEALAASLHLPVRNAGPHCLCQLGPKAHARLAVLAHDRRWRRITQTKTSAAVAV